LPNLKLWLIQLIYISQLQVHVSYPFFGKTHNFIHNGEKS
jgi:hypothetical protein